MEVLKEPRKIQEWTRSFVEQVKALSSHGSPHLQYVTVVGVVDGRETLGEDLAHHGAVGLPAPRWPGCGAAPRAALIPPSGRGQLTLSSSVAVLFADRGSTARRDDRFLQCNTGMGCDGWCSEFSQQAGGWFRS